MPVHRVGKDCWQWGHGKIYCGPGARQKAERQGRAAYSHGYRGREAHEDAKNGSLSKSIRRALSSNEAYQLIDRYHLGTSWLSGGCWVLATALHGMMPGSSMIAIVDQGIVQHVLVEWGGDFWDGDGASSEQELLRRWREIEGLRDPQLRNFDPKTVGGISCPADAVIATRKFLQRHIAGLRSFSGVKTRESSVSRLHVLRLIAEDQSLGAASNRVARQLLADGLVVRYGDGYALTRAGIDELLRHETQED